MQLARAQFKEKAYCECLFLHEVYLSEKTILNAFIVHGIVDITCGLFGRDNKNNQYSDAQTGFYTVV